MHLSCDSVVYLAEIETHISKKTHEVKISLMRGNPQNGKN